MQGGCHRGGSGETHRAGFQGATSALGRALGDGGTGCDGVESPLTLILYCFCGLQIGTAQGMPERTPGPTASLYRRGSKEQTRGSDFPCE